MLGAPATTGTSRRVPSLSDSHKELSLVIQSPPLASVAAATALRSTSTTSSLVNVHNNHRLSTTSTQAKATDRDAATAAAAFALLVAKTTTNTTSSFNSNGNSGSAISNSRREAAAHDESGATAAGSVARAVEKTTTTRSQGLGREQQHLQQKQQLLQQEQHQRNNGHDFVRLEGTTATTTTTLGGCCWGCDVRKILVKNEDNEYGESTTSAGAAIALADEHETSNSAAVALQLEAILSSDGTAGGFYPHPQYNQLPHHQLQHGDECDCVTCLGRELVRVKREILFMIKQKQKVGVEREAGGGGPGVTRVSPVVDVTVTGGSGVPWPYLYVGKKSVSAGSGLPGVDAGIVIEEEFEDADCGVVGRGSARGSDLETFVMVSSGGGVVGSGNGSIVSGCGPGGGGGLVTTFGGHAEMSERGVTMGDKAAAVTNAVEGQLNALLSSAKEVTPTGWKRYSLTTPTTTGSMTIVTGGEHEKERGGGGLKTVENDRRSSGGIVMTNKRHTNLIENQLLTLEEQFWRSRNRDQGQTTTSGMNEQGATAKEKEMGTAARVNSSILESNEDTALLADSSQQTTMSDSTPVKRATTVKVTSTGSGGVVGSSAVIVEREEGGGGGRISGNLSRMKRFEQFLKSLVGKKSVSTSVSNPGDGGLAKDQLESMVGGGEFERISGGELRATDMKSNSRVDRKTSSGCYAMDDEEPPVMLHRRSFGSMSSLNSAAQQKILNILPSSASLSATKRNLSVNNLSTIPERFRVDSHRNGNENRHHHHQHQQQNGCYRTGRTMKGEARGLKTVSCSFSNFENLNESGNGGVKNHRNHLSTHCGDSEVMRRDINGATRRLKESKSTNYLQGMIGTQHGQLRPFNRFRNSLLESLSQVNVQEQCSRCSSILSLAGGTMGKVRCSDSSVESALISQEVVDGKRDDREVDVTTRESGVRGSDVVVVMKKETVAAAAEISPVQSCKLCLGEVPVQQMTGIAQCRCTFCTDCMRAYVEFEILEGAYEISCPDAMCPAQGVVTLTEIAALTSPDLVTKHNRYRLNREIELDKNRTWCPRAGCDTVCLVEGGGALNQASSSQAVISVITTAAASSSKNSALVAYAVKCPTCDEEFCSACKKTWHPRISCEENMKKLAADGGEPIGIPFDSDLIKCCPMCGVAIEKDEGCAQMMCKRCKHVFCWYCLASLDDDFLLRHYDKGPCKNKLGHSRASVVWHRAQVIGIFAGFGILLLVASPLLLLAAPCIVCCKCRICSGGPKMEEPMDFDPEFDPLSLLQAPTERR